MSEKKRRAKYVSTLVYVDEPQLILLESKKTKIIAMAIDLGGHEFPFMAATMTDVDWRKYKRGSVDLRYLFAFARLRRLYKFDLGELNLNTGLLMEPWPADLPVANFLPDSRFFVRDHTEPLPIVQSASALQHFALDGAWGLPDFASFYNKISDIYAFISAIAKFKSAQTSYDEKRSIISAFAHHPFRGGFSYVNLFDHLERLLGSGDSLQVQSIRYASAGYVNVKGNRSVFAEIQEFINIFSNKNEEIGKQYNKLYKYLADGDFLAQDSAALERTSPEILKLIRDEAKTLAHMMSFAEFDLMDTFADRNEVVLAKIIMAFYRRIEQSFMFFAQGRVEFGDLT